MKVTGRTGPRRWGPLLFSIVLGGSTLAVGLRVLWIKRFTSSGGLEDPHCHHRYPPHDTHRDTTASS